MRVAALSHLKSLQALEMAIRLGSFAGAGEQLGITPAAVGQRVKALEVYLGVTLLRRGRFGIEPTDELAAAISHLKEGMRSLEAAASALDLQRASDLYLAVPSDFARLWLAPRLPEFRTMHPNVKFSINGEGDAPPRIGHADCEVQYTNDVAGRHELLFHDVVLPICSPANFHRIDVLDPATRLEGFPLLHVDFYKDDPAGLSWPSWLHRHGIERTDPQRGMRFRSIVAALDAVAADAGVALTGCALVSEMIDDGRLSIAYTALAGQLTTHAFCARFRSRQQSARLLDRFRTWLLQRAAETEAWARSMAVENVGS